jgi:hypothetical protein
MFIKSRRGGWEGHIVRIRKESKYRYAIFVRREWNETARKTSMWAKGVEGYLKRVLKWILEKQGWGFGDGNWIHLIQ